MPGVPINFQKAAQCFVCFIILCWAKISFSNTVEILHNLFPTSPKSQWGRGKFRNGAAAYEHFKVGRPFLCNCFVYKLGPVNTGCKSTEVVLLTYTNRRGKGKLHRTDTETEYKKSIEFITPLKNHTSHVAPITNWRDNILTSGVPLLLCWPIQFCSVGLRCNHLTEPGSKISPESYWIFAIFLPSLFYNIKGVNLYK